MKSGYITVGLDEKIEVLLARKTKEFLKSVKPKGCPFNDYSMFDLLKDWVCMYSWQMERNKKIPLADFVRQIKTDGKFIYKEPMIYILELENL